MSKFYKLFLFKSAILIGAFFLFSVAQAQQSVGIGTADPNPNAILDIKSDKQGLLVPRLNSTQRVQMGQVLQSSTGNDGMIVFDTDTGKFYYWFEGVWKEGLGTVSSGEVAGDLNGEISAPLVVGIQGKAVSNATPTSSQVLKWNGTAWAPAADVGKEYSAGAGIAINNGELVNTGDLDGEDDLLMTDVAGGELSGTFNNLIIQNNAVTSAKIADDAITREKIASNIAGPGLVQEADGSIGVASGTGLTVTGDAINLSNTGVTTGAYGQKDKVAQFTVDAQGRIITATEVEIEAIPRGLAGGDLNGTYPDPTLKDGAVTQAKIANDAVGLAQMKNDDPNAMMITDPTGNPRWFETYPNHVIVTAPDGQIIQESRSNFATSSLQNGYIFIGGPDNKATSISANTNGHILIGNGAGLNSVDVSGDIDVANTGIATIQPGAINNAKIANDAVSSTKILDGTIVTADLSDASVTGTKLSANSVTSDKIVDGTIVNADLAVNSIQSSNIADGTIANTDLSDGSVNSEKVLDGSISDADLNKADIPLSGFGAATAEVDLGAHALTNVADPVDAQDAATKNYVDAASTADGDKDATNEIQDLSLLAGNSLTLSDDATPVDLSPYLDNTDDQQINLTGNNLELEDGGSVDLSSYLDNTDNQDLANVLSEGSDAGGSNIGNLADPVDAQDAATKNYVDAASTADGDKDATNEIQDLSLLAGNSLILSDDATPVDLSPYLDNTDDQQINLTGNNLELEDGGSVDLSSYLDNTDNQDLANVLGEGSDAGGSNISNLADPVNTQDAATKNYVDAASTADGDKDATNEIQDLSLLAGNSLTLSDDATPVDLTPYLDNTDNQQINLTGNNLELEDGGSVDLSSYLDNTDNQDLANVLGEGNDAGANNISNLADPVDAQDAATKNYVDAASTADGDKDATNEIQDLSLLAGNSLTLSDDATPVDLSPYLDNTDDQQINLTGNNLELEDGGSVDLSSYLDNTDNQDLANVLGVGSDAGGSNISNLADPVNAQDAATKNYVDAASTADGDKDATNEIQDLSLMPGNSLSLSDDATPVDLTPYLDNTDDQQISLTGNNLELEDGGSVDLSSYLDNTDNQDLENVLSLGNDAGNLTITNLANPADAQDAATKNYVDALDALDGDKSSTNESLTDATLNGKTLELTESGNLTTVDMSSLVSSGTRGSLWRQGTTAPVPLGTELAGDKYLHTVTGDIWNFNGTIWENTSQSIKGPQGSQGPPGLGIGTVFPGSGIKITGDFLAPSTIAVITDESTLGFTGNAGDSDRMLRVMDGGIGSSQIVDNAISTSKIQNAAITAAKIAQNEATNGQVLKWNGSAWVASDDNANDGDASATNELQNLSISGNAISISSGNSVNISSVAPSENQVLTYKSGNWTASNPSTTGSIVRTGNYAVDPLDFVGLGNNSSESLFYYGDGDFVSSDEDGKIAAPVHLTDGVQITEVRFHFYDSHGQDMSFSLTRKPRNGGSSEVLATVNSVGSPGNDVRILSAINHNVVDNSLYSYRVIVNLRGQNYGSAMSHRVYSVTIQYTETIN